MRMDVLDLLRRQDKHFLGSGRGALYAPPFPKFRRTIGFWDECFFADLRIERLFTVLLLDSSGAPMSYRSEVVEWRPDRFVLRHVCAFGVIREERCVLGDAWVCTLEPLVLSEPLFAVLWAALDVTPQGGAPWRSVIQGSLTERGAELVYATAWPGEMTPDRTGVEKEVLSAGGNRYGAPSHVHLAFGVSGDAVSRCLVATERQDLSPYFRLSPVGRRWVRGRLVEGAADLRGLQDGVAHALIQAKLHPGQPLALCAGAGLTAEAAQTALAQGLSPDARLESERSWTRYFAGVPQFTCSDPVLEQSYWYRWYGLRLNTVHVPQLPRLASPFVAEGIGFFRNLVTYSSQALLREVAWMHDPGLALGICDNLARNQREDGSFPGHTYSTREPRDFYHADFVPGTRRLIECHGDVVPDTWNRALQRYGAYLATQRLHPLDDEAAMTLVFDQNETGQEYMSRYTFVRDSDDPWAAIRMLGVEATGYAMSLFEYLGGTDPQARETAARLKKGMEQYAWDAEREMFTDLAPDGRRSPAIPTTSFYPLGLSGSLDRAVLSLERYVFAEDHFWLPAGFPSTSLSDPSFSANGEWEGVLRNCPWNGRSWPMANSHLVETCFRLAKRDPSLRRRAMEALRKSLRLLLHQGDPKRPTCFEHYHPITGDAAEYRGYDDYMHSWIVDLILRGVVGVSDGTDLDPLDPTLDWECTSIPRAGGWLHARQTGGKLTSSWEVS